MKTWICLSRVKSFRKRRFAAIRSRSGRPSWSKNAKSPDKSIKINFSNILDFREDQNPPLEEEEGTDDSTKLAISL
jgi:hypothetical protein